MASLVLDLRTRLWDPYVYEVCGAPNIGVQLHEQFWPLALELLHLNVSELLRLLLAQASAQTLSSVAHIWAG